MLDLFQNGKLLFCFEIPKVFATVESLKNLFPYFYHSKVNRTLLYLEIHLFVWIELNALTYFHRKYHQQCFDDNRLK